MAELVSRVIETTQTTGTGTLDLDGATTGYRAFADAATAGEISSGDSVYYVIEDDPAAPTEWEYGIGTWTSGSPNTLSRDTVLASSNSGSKVSLQGGTTYTVTCSAVGEAVGRLVQRQIGTNAAAVNASGTAVFDDTAPQSTETTEIATVSITPKQTANRLLIRIELWGTKVTSGTVVCALFQDANTSAIAASANFAADGEGLQMVLTHEMAAGTTSSTTFKAHVGSTAGSVKVNANSSATRVFGGVSVAKIIVEEVRG